MKKRHIALLSSIVVSMAAIGVTLPLMVTASNNINVMEPDKNYYAPINFEDNSEETFESIIQTEETTFNDSLPTADFSDDPNDEMYSAIFESINDEIIANDIKIWLKSLIPEQQQQFQLCVENVQVGTSVTRSNLKINKIKVDFQIYNNTDTNQLLVYSDINQYVGFKPHDLINNSIIIEAPINYTFFQDGDKTRPGYNYESAQWIIDDSDISLNNFKFGNYSKSINVVINNASSSIGYYDISEMANSYLDNLTGATIANEIIGTNDALLKAISDNLGPVQSILQKLVENKGTTVFLKDIAGDVKYVIESILETSTPDLKGMGNLISDLLQDKKLMEIILNNKQVIVNMLALFGLDNETIAGVITNGTEQSLKSLFDSLIEMDLVPGKTDEIKDLLEQSESVGIITLLKSNITMLTDLIKSVIPSDSADLDLVFALIDVLDLHNQDKPILQVIVDICSAKDSEGSSLLKQLFDTLLGNSAFASFGTILDQALFNNSNLTVDNLKSTINAIANPKVSKGSGTVVDYQEWWDSMEITNTINKAEYDQTTHMANIDVEVRFSFKKDLYVSITELIKILPANLTIDDISLPTGLIGKFAPKWVAIKAGDYVANNITINNVIHYDVIRNSEGKDVLSWQASSRSIIDVNMPQTVQILWEDSMAGTGDLIINLTKSMVYHKYSEYKRLKPKQSVLNEVEIKDYNYNKKYEVTLTNKVTPELLAQINTEITNNMKMVTLSNKYEWKYKELFWTRTKTIYKTEADNTFDRSSLYNQFFEVTNGELRVPLYLEFNSEFIIPETKFLAGLFTIPEVLTNKVSFWSPNDLCVDGEMQNDWSYTLA